MGSAPVHSSNWLVVSNRLVFGELMSSTFWLQLVWHLFAGGKFAGNFFSQVGSLVSANQLKNMV